MEHEKYNEDDVYENHDKYNFFVFFLQKFSFCRSDKKTSQALTGVLDGCLSCKVIQYFFKNVLLIIKAWTCII